MTDQGSPKPAPENSHPRVLFVLGSLDPETGGPAQSGPNMWIAARRRGIDVVAAIVEGGTRSRGEDHTMQRLAAEGINLRRFPVTWPTRHSRRWGFSLPLFFWLLRHARRFDIVHAHGAWMFSTLAALGAAQLAGTPFVLTPHESLTDGDLAKGGRRVAAVVKSAVKRLYMRCVDAILVASTTEREGTAARGPLPPIAVIYHPVVDDRTRPSPARSDAPRNGRLRVGFLGRFDPKKNIELLLHAVRDNPWTQLEIAGGGPTEYEQRLRDLARALAVEDRVAWRGFIDAAARADFFAAIDVLAMPSVFEGFGMVAAEAMAAGVPAIVSRSSGVAELIAAYECGEVVDPAPGAVSAALRRLHESPEGVRDLGRRALDMTRRELTLSAYGVKLAAFYREVLGGAAQRREM